MDKQTLIFLGTQGSGKGTQIELLKEYLKSQDPACDILHYDSGAAMRKLRDEEGYTQHIMRDSLARGEIQPDFIATTLFGNFLFENLKEQSYLFMDGYPRTLAQAEVFTSAMQYYKRTALGVVHINLSEEVAKERLLLRSRHDDTEETIKTRFAWYRQQVLPTLEYFRANPLYTMYEVDGNHPIEEVHASILKTLTNE